MDIDTILQSIKRLIPRKIFSILERPYHYTLAILGAIIYRFPSKKLIIIGVTGTKGKTTTTELINAILEEAGYKTALAGTLRFKIADKSSDNLFKKTMPGRFFLQHFLRRAVTAGCTHAILEISSEGVLNFRHRFIDLDALVVTNIAPEHIEAHGSYEKYIAAKLEIAKRVLKSGKQKKIIVLNGDDKETPRFRSLGIKEEYFYSLKDAEPYSLSPEGVVFNWRGEKINSKLVGLFNIYNALSALTLGKALQIKQSCLIKAIEKFPGVRGRMEKILAGQNFTVIVDYAHTPESLEAVYRTYEKNRKICVLSGTGGGRDHWKRPKMGEIAGRYCDEIILTNEDPYDEDPKAIVQEIKSGIKNPKSEIVMDRREAMARAFRKARSGDVVLITGKGTDPYIMGPRGSKIPWSDARIAKEELKILLLK